MTRAQVAASARAAAEEALDRMRGDKFEPTGEQFKPSTINHAVAVRDTHLADALTEICRSARERELALVTLDALVGAP